MASIKTRIYQHYYRKIFFYLGAKVTFHILTFIPKTVCFPRDLSA